MKSWKKNTKSSHRQLIAKEYGPICSIYLKILISSVGFYFKRKNNESCFFFAPNDVIGSSICKAINPSPSLDFAKVSFVFQALFNNSEGIAKVNVQLEEFQRYS